MNPEPTAIERLIPEEGWHILHIFYQIDHSNWSMLTDSEQLEAKTDLTELAQEIRTHPETQLLLFSVVSPKADIACMILTPDLHDLNAFEKRMGQSLGPDILTPVYSYLSMTERSEYTTTAEIYSKELVDDDGVVEGSEEHQAKMAEFEHRMKKYTQDRLYPNMPDWPVFCFYNMNKRRNVGQNWYASDFETRRQLMLGHARIGRTYAGKVRQLITGSTGLDDAEWGVTLFAHDTYQIKDIVYKMRFDEVSSVYADFGEFYIGIQLPLDELFRRVGI